ncbi:hypothetical protein HZC07_02640 [Candidatus Micrarchaeota archaeon]|nr:hypothetical protein [Candidatus Micrarchaeota archaeon]
MMKQLIFILAIIFLFGCAALQPAKQTPLNMSTPVTSSSVQISKCGDAFCAADEYCNVCAKDCGCTNGLVCDNTTGICKQNKTPITCPTNQYFNSQKEKCLDKPNFNETLIDELIQTFGKQNNATLEVISMDDSFYGVKPVKEVIVKDNMTQKGFIFIVDSNTSILDIYSN